MLENIRSEIRMHKKIKKAALYFIFFGVLVSSILVFLSFKINHLIIWQNLNYKAKIVVEEKSNFAGKLYFNEVPNTEIFTNLILEHIDQARKTIDVAMFSFDNVKLKDALVKAQKRGVQVRLVLDKSNSVQHRMVFGKNSPLEIKDVGQENSSIGDYMHHKFAVFDADSESPTLLFGSFNYTVNQEKYDPSFILESEDKQIIQGFKEEFGLLWSGTRGYGKIRRGFKPFGRKIIYNNGFSELWFAPGFGKNSLKQRTIDLVNSAKKSVDVMIWQMTDWDVAAALLSKAKQGVKVKIITDDYYIWSKQSVFPNVVQKISKEKIDNVEIISDFHRTLNLDGSIKTNENYYNPFLHQHTIIVDDAVVLSGTDNWSYNGFFKNDEAAIISDVDFWAKGFRESFNDNYLKYRKIKTSFTLDGLKLTLLDKNYFKQGNKLAIYNETSDVDSVPNYCFKTELNNVKEFDLPKDCVLRNSVLYIYDTKDNIVTSAYLFF
jgi:phosphatidylserine/phosphatidylglycerophosphate/cardiolipin synthase-like enzyme